MGALMMHEQLYSAIQNIETVVVGKRREIELSVVAMLAGGHVLLEDVPGVGKTMLVKAIAKTLGANFKRIQFTPDLLPSDVTGVSIYNQQTQNFEFRPGPIMSHIVLADEINRTSPKTQSALLEALEEHHVTVDGETRAIEKPFFVMATQNPIEYAGTYPLPEAQLDRFIMKLSIGYPSIAEELEVLNRLEKAHPLECLKSVLTPKDILEMQAEVNVIYVDELVKAYIVQLVQMTREHDDVRLGVSPRGTIALMKAGQAYAYLQERDYVIPDDIKTLAPFVLAHRILLRADLDLSGLTQEKVIADVLKQVPIPLGKKELLRG